MPLSAAVIMRGISSNELQINHCNNDIINNNNWKVITSKRITGFFHGFSVEVRSNLFQQQQLGRSLFRMYRHALRARGVRARRARRRLDKHTRVKNSNLRHI